MNYTEWKLTDQEIAYINETGADIGRAQEAKKQAYIKAGGIILNPEALPELYEALRAIVKVGLSHFNQDDIDQANRAIVKAESNSRLNWRLGNETTYNT